MTKIAILPFLMAMAVAGLVAEGQTEIGDAEAADVSYPTFWETLAGIANGE